MKIIIIIFISLFFISCGGADNDLNLEKTYQIKMIDNCEYIYVSRRPYSGEFSLTHKDKSKNH